MTPHRIEVVRERSIPQVELVLVIVMVDVIHQLIHVVKLQLCQVELDIVVRVAQSQQQSHTLKSWPIGTSNVLVRYQADRFLNSFARTSLLSATLDGVMGIPLSNSHKKPSGDE